MTEHSFKTVLITGAAKRIGRAMALDLAQSGWAVAVHYNNSAEQADDVVAEITAKGGKAAAIGGDLMREDETQQVIPRAVAALGPLAALVNNASTFENDTPDNATRESWDLHFEVNLRAPFVLSQGFARQLPEVGRGSIVNIIDERVWNLTPWFTTYTLSKAGLWAMTQTLAMALAPRIRVNAIGPGPTLPSKRQSQDDFDKQCQGLPLQRGTNPQEICDALRYVLAAPAMTGQMIALDGGQHLGWAFEDSAPQE